MGLWKDIKKEWTWENIKKSFPEIIAMLIAFGVANLFYSRYFYMLIWALAFFVSKAIIIQVIEYIKEH